MLTKIFQLITLATILGGAYGTHGYAQGTNAPLALFINGGGSVSPLANGEVLEVGQTYSMVAIPGAGFAFSSWNPVNVFTFTEVVLDPYGSPLPPVVSTVASPVPAFTYEASLSFVMQPLTVISDVPGVRTVTEVPGWQANFEPVVLNIQLGDSAVILSWTNSSFTLQTTPAPGGAYTNIPGAASPHTNDLSGPAQYFRLVSPLTSEMGAYEPEPNQAAPSNGTITSLFRAERFRSAVPGQLRNMNTIFPPFRGLSDFQSLNPAVVDSAQDKHRYPIGVHQAAAGVFESEDKIYALPLFVLHLETNGTYQVQCNEPDRVQGIDGGGHFSYQGNESGTWRREPQTGEILLQATKASHMARWFPHVFKIPQDSSERLEAVNPRPQGPINSWPPWLPLKSPCFKRKLT